MSNLFEIAPAMVKAGAALLLTYCLVVGGYRLLLHPLSKYPGPLFAKLTDGYAGYFASQQKLHLQMAENHTKYGTVVRQGPDRLLFNTASALQDIYRNDRLTKSFAYALSAQQDNHDHVFNTIDKESHRRKRRMVSRAISDRALREFEPTMDSQMNIFLRHILASARAQEPVNVTTAVNRLILDIVGFLSFGYSLETQTTETNRWLGESLAGGNHFINCYMNFPALLHLRIDLFTQIIAPNILTRYSELLGRMVQARLSQPRDAYADLYAAITNEVALEGEKPLTDSEIFREAVFFIPAGGDTSAGAICATLFYLSRHRHVYERLAAEIRSTFTSGADIRGGPKLAGCRYLRACIDEALRMSPPVGGTMWREQESWSKKAGEPVTVDGHVIPHGTQVGVAVYALHHNEAYFPSAYEYKPERWLESETSPEQRRRMLDAFTAFSLGPRSCPGKSMAYLQLSLVVSKLMWFFDFEAAPGDLRDVGSRKAEAGGDAEEYEMRDIIISLHDGPVLTFKPREGVCGEIDTADT